jgi:hypothetical protein
MNHYDKVNVRTQLRKVKVGSYIEVSIDDLTNFCNGEDDGAVIYCGSVVNIVYLQDTRNIVPEIDYIEVCIDMKKRPDIIISVRETYIDIFELTDMTHLFVY